MKRLYIYAVESIIAGGCRIALAETEPMKREGECLYAEFSSPQAETLFIRAKKTAETSVFGEPVYLKPTGLGAADDYISSQSAQSVETSVFAFLTGDGDGEARCRIPFVRRRRTNLSADEWTIVEARVPARSHNGLMRT